MPPKVAPLKRVTGLGKGKGLMGGAAAARLAAESSMNRQDRLAASKTATENKRKSSRENKGVAAKKLDHDQEEVEEGEDGGEDQSDSGEEPGSEGSGSEGSEGSEGSDLDLVDEDGGGGAADGRQQKKFRHDDRDRPPVAVEVDTDPVRRMCTHMSGRDVYDMFKNGQLVIPSQHPVSSYHSQMPAWPGTPWQQQQPQQLPQNTPADGNKDAKVFEHLVGRAKKAALKGFSRAKYLTVDDVVLTMKEDDQASVDNLDGQDSKKLKASIFAVQRNERSKVVDNLKHTWNLVHGSHMKADVRAFKDHPYDDLYWFSYLDAKNTQWATKYSKNSFQGMRCRDTDDGGPCSHEPFFEVCKKVLGRSADNLTLSDVAFTSTALRSIHYKTKVCEEAYTDMKVDLNGVWPLKK